MQETSLAATISFVVYTLGIVFVGLYSARFASRSTSDYLLAGKGLGAWVTALSASASSESGWVALGLVGTAFTQGGLMCLALIFLPWITVHHADGWSGMISALASQDPHLVHLAAGKEGYLMFGLIIGRLGIGLGYPGRPHVIIRFMAARDETAVRRGRLIAMAWGFFVFTGAVVLGLSCRALFGTLPDAEQALPIIAVKLLPGVAAGLMLAAVLAAVLAAICSTADSQLLVASSSISHDLYARLSGKDLDSRHVVAMDRLAVGILGILAILLALSRNRVIFDFVLYAWAGLGAAFGPPLILGLLWKKTTSTGAIAGALAGFFTVIIWKNIPAASGVLYELVPGFFLGLFVVWGVSLFFSSECQTPLGPNHH